MKPIDYQISARQPDLVTVNKKRREPTEQWALPSETQRKQKERKILKPGLRTDRKTMKLKGEGDTIDTTSGTLDKKEQRKTNCSDQKHRIWNTKVTLIPTVIDAFGKISKRTGRVGNKRTNGDHQIYSIFRISENTEKSPEDLKGLAIVQTPKEDHQLTLVWKTLKEIITVDFAVLLKESEKKDKYLELARKLKKLWNMKVTFIWIVISALDIVTKNLIKRLEDLEIKGRVETTETTA